MYAVPSAPAACPSGPKLPEGWGDEFQTPPDSLLYLQQDEPSSRGMEGFCKDTHLVLGFEAGLGGAKRK